MTPTLRMLLRLALASVVMAGSAVHAQTPAAPTAEQAALRMVAPSEESGETTPSEVPAEEAAPAESSAPTTAPAAVAPAPETTASAPASPPSGDTQFDQVTIEKAAQIMKTLGLVRPPAERLAGGLEKDETTPTELFNEKEVRQLLSANPTVLYQVVYEGKPLPDPMIVPWIRNLRVVQERYDEAVDLLAQGRIAESKERFESIVQDFPEADVAKQSREILAKLRAIEASERKVVPQEVLPKAVAKDKAPDIQLDPQVRVTAVVVDTLNPAENRAMVSGRTYRAGETIRGFANHKIVKIEDTSVVIEVEQRGLTKQFQIPVQAQRGSK
ncbi:MAG: hypothetical protein N2111_05200 [Candidatus Sumerlaeaceae bacterium]|nr:hypothetical protein [Candidatus Sumerlaeaceae bacterium]